MKLPLAIRHFFPSHKYAINAKLLGDNAELAWSNLGYWDSSTTSYLQACRQLADQLAQAVQLSASDHLLDLGCGQGASLLHWSRHYAVTDFSAVELQEACVVKIQQQTIAGLKAVYQASFLNLASLPCTDPFDVILCVDAAYHYALPVFLAAVTSRLKPQGRVGFHYLIRSAHWESLSTLQQQTYRYVLKTADVKLEHLPDESEMRQIFAQQGFRDVQMIPLSQAVLGCFAHYIAEQSGLLQSGSYLERFKIQMTAKLCAKLYQEGNIEYVQITAQKQS